MATVPVPRQAAHLEFLVACVGGGRAASLQLPTAARTPVPSTPRLGSSFKRLPPRPDGLEVLLQHLLIRDVALAGVLREAFLPRAGEALAWGRVKTWGLEVRTCSLSAALL